MIGAHAGTLAFVPLCVLARPRANLLLAIGLDDVNLAVALQRPINEVVEPGLRQLPISVIAADLFRCHSPAVLQPLPVVVSKRESHAKLLATPGPAQDDRCWLLFPNIVEGEPRHKTPTANRRRSLVTSAATRENLPVSRWLPPHGGSRSGSEARYGFYRR